MKISVDEKVFDIVNRIPEIKEILINLGFTHLANEKMFNTVAKVISIRKACNMHKIDFSVVKEALNKQGIEIEEDGF
ncbi:MAG: DUF1858 domain-containing protein [Erysipelothrix sp.]|nr:DUF1858 domain-containing protein [Erysipelothrix sp.]